MWNVANDEKFLLVVDPGEHSAYLPRVGEPCKIRSDAFTFDTKLPDTKLPDVELSEEERRKQHRIAVNKVLETLNSIPATDDYASEVIKRLPSMADMGEKVRAFMPMDTIDQNETTNEWEARVHIFFRENPHFLPAVEGPASGDDTAEAEGNAEDNPENQWLSAHRQEILFPHASIEMHVFQVSKPVKKQDDGSEPRLVTVSIPMLDRNEKESFQDFVARVKLNMFVVSIQKDPSDKTLRAEAHAANSLAHPPSSDMDITPESLDAYKYILDFRAGPRTSLTSFRKYQAYRDWGKPNARREVWTASATIASNRAM
jgi:hypothetical protein